MNTTIQSFKTNLLLLIVFLLTAISCGQADKHENTTKEAEQVQPSLFLLSKGLVNDTLKSAFLEFIDSDPFTQKVAVVVNASSSDSKKVKKTKKVKKRFASIGFDPTKIELFDLMKRSPDSLAEFDIIYTLGGNPFRLLDEVKKSNADTIIRKLAFQNKILMGYSAGSLLLGPNMELMNAMDSLLGFNEMRLTELSCIGLYDFLIFPHYDEFTQEVQGLAEAIDQYEATSKHKIYRLNDNQAITIKTGNIRIIGN